MSQRKPLYLCMGSACHQLGGYRLIPQLEELITRHGAGERLELKGAFCLEHCEQGRVLKLEERVLTGLTSENLEARFVREILPAARRE